MVLELVIYAKYRVSHNIGSTLFFVIICCWLSSLSARWGFVRSGVQNQGTVCTACLPCFIRYRHNCVFGSSTVIVPAAATTKQTQQHTLSQLFFLLIPWLIRKSLASAVGLTHAWWVSHMHASACMFHLHPFCSNTKPDSCWKAASRSMRSLVYL